MAAQLRATIWGASAVIWGPNALPFEVPGDKLWTKMLKFWVWVYRPLWPTQAIQQPITIQNMRFERIVIEYLAFVLVWNIWVLYPLQILIQIVMKYLAFVFVWNIWVLYPLQILIQIVMKYLTFVFVWNIVPLQILIQIVMKYLAFVFVWNIWVLYPLQGQNVPHCGQLLRPVTLPAPPRFMMMLPFQTQKYLSLQKIVFKNHWKKYDSFQIREFRTE